MIQLANTPIEREVFSLICAANIYRGWYMHNKSTEKLKKALEINQDPKINLVILKELGKLNCQPNNCKCGCCL